MVPRDRWFATAGLLALSAIATAAVYLELAAHRSTTIWVHSGTGHIAGPGLIAGVIAGMTAVMFAILRPWSFQRGQAARAWAGIIVLVAAALFGVRFLGHAGPELAPVAWWMLLVAGMCAALVVQALAAELRPARPAAPAARLLRDRR